MFHGVPSSEVVNKEVIKNRWVLKPQGEGVKARFVMKHFNTCKDENNDFFAGTPTTSVVQFGFGFGSKNASLWESHKQSRVSMFPLRFVMRG